MKVLQLPGPKIYELASSDHVCLLGLFSDVTARSHDSTSNVPSLFFWYLFAPLLLSPGNMSAVGNYGNVVSLHLWTVQRWAAGCASNESPAGWLFVAVLFWLCNTVPVYQVTGSWLLLVHSSRVVGFLWPTLDPYIFICWVFYVFDSVKIYCSPPGFNVY